jgi:two-component system nitrate/nitrite response regulator NarP
MVQPHSIAEISVLIADDHCLIRDALVQTLKADPKFSITTADSYASAHAAITRLGKVDVCLLDLVMPGMNGLESIEEFVNLNAGGAVVVFSGNATPLFSMQAVALGARGFIPKTLPLRSLTMAIHLIASGEVFVPIVTTKQAARTEDDGFDRLTPRELLVLKHVSGGLTNKEIAWEIGIVEVTVKMHMRSICKKLNAKNRAHAVILATQVGQVRASSIFARLGQPH